VGSLAELSELAGRDLNGMDPHRPDIDEVTFGCPSCGQEARRVPYLIDVWFDAGAMPYAQWGYRGPGSDGEGTFEGRFPADFIAEGLDQTRGWFYTLMAESVLLFGQSSYRNVVCLGLLLDGEGRKMSKRLGNAVEPATVIDRFGADALRWFLIASGSPWADRRVSMEGFAQIVRQFVLTLWNTYAFFVTYANIDQPDLGSAPPPAERPLLDRWALSQLHRSVAVVREAMDGYDATRAAKRIAELVDDLSNWYVRRSRRRFWDPGRSVASSEDKLAAHATLHECLVTVAGLLAPFTPFLSEELYRNLVAERDSAAPESVHLTDFPVAHPELIDEQLENTMAIAREVVSLGRQVRTDAKVRVRQPLAHAAVHVAGDPRALEPLLSLVADELNVKGVRFAESAEELSGWRAKPNYRVLGPRLGQRVQDVAGTLAGDDGTLAGRLATGETVELSVDGQVVSLAPGDVELVQQPREGWAVGSDGTVTVALDLDVTDELRREGFVREIVRAVQDLRKAAGLEVADRIVLGLEAGPGVLSTVQAFQANLAAEVLAVEVLTRPVDDPAAVQDLTIDGERVGLSLRRP
jgi:isoleucyl-tRNA synthetase